MAKKVSLSRLIAMTLVILMIVVLGGCNSSSPASSTPQNATPGSSTTDKSTTPSAPAAEKPYKFAVIAPFTGSNAQYGQAYKRATDLLVELVNDAGGINGGKVEISYYDDKNDATECVTIATNLVSDPELLGVVGSQTSTPSMAIAPLFQKAGIPLVSPNASHDDFAAVGNFIFRATYLQSETASATAQAVYDQIKDEIPDIKVGMIYMNTDWGLGFYEHFQERINSLGGAVTTAETYIVNQTQDFTPLLTKIKNAGCNVLVLAPNYSEGAQIVKQAKALGIDVPMFGSTMLFKKEFLEIAGADAESMHIMTMFYADNPNESFQKLKKAYAEKYGADAVMDEYTVKAYDALNMLIEGAQDAGHDRDGIRNYISKLKDWPGTLATLTMDDEGNPSGPMFIVKVENGEFAFLG
jgi:branched-chain amino acid transport system substrate-binding protein